MMMGQINHDQGQLLYSFNLEEVVPDDHLIRSIARVLNFSWFRVELAPHYSHTGRPSIVGYVFAIRSERALCHEDLPSFRKVSTLTSQFRTRLRKGEVLGRLLLNA
jgi:transposase